MDQVKIGKFIADIRKEKNMTQRQLAEIVGVSDKAVSKWENGNGMPEMATLMPLCQVLEISVNELLSGEMLSHDDYSQRAEENIMHLIQEKEESKKDNKYKMFNAIVTLVLSLLAVVLAICMMFVMSVGFNTSFLYMIIDSPTFLVMFIVAVVAMSAARLWKAFFRAFGIIFARREYSICEVEESAVALRMVSNVLAATGVLSTITGMITIFNNIWSFEEQTWIGPSLSVAVIGIVYGALFYLIFLPIRSRLEVIAARLRGQS